ncbi:MAG TPA: hypothetical protein VEX86_05820 [Longimicrobium sp.]|nr:hypothetical protein [Longimicrobium sp.]
MRRVILTAVLLLSPLSWAAAQGNPARRIEAARQRAAQAGIPVALLDGKVAEGRAKSIPEERIAAAVERRLASLERARAAMTAGTRPPAVTAADLTVAADALDAGVDPAVVGRVAQSAAADRRAVAIAVLTELVKQGLSSEQALARVTAALANGPEALRQLPGEARSNANGRGNAGGARRGPPEGRGSANPNAHGGRGNAGGGPPASVPGPRGKGRGRGGGQGGGKP